MTVVEGRIRRLGSELCHRFDHDEIERLLDQLERAKRAYRKAKADSESWVVKR